MAINEEKLEELKELQVRARKAVDQGDLEEAFDVLSKLCDELKQLDTGIPETDRIAANIDTGLLMLDQDDLDKAEDAANEALKASGAALGRH